MTTWAIVLAIHILCAVVWVGGMFFALLVLRPSLAVLDPAQRLALHGQVFRRFFLVVWHVMPIALVTGYAILFEVYGGLANSRWAVNVMQLLGLVMAVLFLAVFFGPWREFRRTEDRAVAAQAANRIRLLITVNLALGLATVVVAAFARW